MTMATTSECGVISKYISLSPLCKNSNDSSEFHILFLQPVWRKTFIGPFNVSLRVIVTVLGLPDEYSSSSETRFFQPDF